MNTLFWYIFNKDRIQPMIFTILTEAMRRESFKTGIVKASGL